MAEVEEIPGNTDEVENRFFYKALQRIRRSTLSLVLAVAV